MNYFINKKKVTKIIKIKKSNLNRILSKIKFKTIKIKMNLEMIIIFKKITIINKRFKSTK